MVVLCGPNGAGKTNLIEAISFLAPGRGLRRAALEEVAFNEGDGSWAVAAEVEGALGLATLGTGIERSPKMARQVTALPDRSRTGRFGVRFRRPSSRSLAGAGDGFAVCRAPSERRRFSTAWRSRSTPSMPAGLTRSIGHCDRATGCWRRRARPHWLDAVEHETAELAVAVAGTARRGRASAGSRARAAASRIPDRRDFAGRLDGEADPGHPAIEVEERYRAVLRDNAPATPPPGARWMVRISPIFRSSMRARTSPPARLRRASRRRC